MTFLSKVEDAFQISGRGCVIVPAVASSDVDFRLREQDSIQLRNPDGQIVDTHIAGIEMVCGPNVGGRMAFLLPKHVTKGDVPAGTEIWLVQDEEVQ